MISAKLSGRLDKYIIKLLPKKYSPNTYTLLGLGVTAISSFFLALGYFKIGGALIFLAGLFDMADGAIARATGRVSEFGGFRAEIFLGSKCNVGLVERPERIILLGIGAIFDLFIYILPLLAFLSNITVFQRIYYVWQKTTSSKKELG